MADTRQKVRVPASNGRDPQENPASPAQEQTSSGTEEHPQSFGPVGAGDHVVKPGECISSIAKRTGHFWETIWNHPENAELREVRKDPNVLLPGDRVTIPALRKKQESGQTEMRHRFRRKGEPTLFRIQLLIEGQPQGGKPFRVEVDGKEVFSGTTAADGIAHFPIPGDARKGVLHLTDEAEQREETYELLFGRLDPAAETVGLQQRLHNMGYPWGSVNAKTARIPRAALEAFQRDHGLPITGKPDADTVTKIPKIYGS